MCSSSRCSLHQEGFTFGEHPRHYFRIPK
jgi:hypothetical protein